MRTLLLLLLSTVLLSAADITGTWSGTAELTRDGETTTSTALLILRQSGASITGTVGPNAGDRHAITKGTVDGSAVTLDFTVAEHELRITLLLKLEGEKLSGEVKARGPNGEQMNGKMDLSRTAKGA